MLQLLAGQPQFGGRDRLNRVTLTTYFEKLVGLTGVINLPGSDTTSPTAAAFLAYTKSTSEFELLGTNAVSSAVAAANNGGITLTTTTSANDSLIIVPHLTAGSAWTNTLWDTTKEPTFECELVTGATITSYTAWTGFKLTNTPTPATDADQVYFYVDSTDNAWSMQYSIGGTLTKYVIPVSSVAGAAAKLKASTKYHFRIEIFTDRTFMAYLNGAPIADVPFPILTSLTTFIPYIGVKTLTTAARVLTAKYLECGRDF